MNTTQANKVKLEHESRKKGHILKGAREKSVSGKLRRLQWDALVGQTAEKLRDNIKKAKKNDALSGVCENIGVANDAAFKAGTQRAIQRVKRGSVTGHIMGGMEIGEHAEFVFGTAPKRIKQGASLVMSLIGWVRG